MRSLLKILKATGQSLWLYPFSYFLLQVFDAVSETTLFILGEPSDGSVALYVATVFPLTWLMTGLGTAATYRFFESTQASGLKPSLRSVFEALRLKLKALVQAELIVGAAVLVGIFLILPGIYFLGIYLFVPCLVMARTPRPVFSYLSESQALAKKSLWKVLAVSFAILLTGLGLGEIQSQAASLLGTQNPWILYLTRLSVSMFLNMTINVFICHCFWHLTGNSKCSMKSPNE